ncbi:hypothetical protein JRQ81_019368 [Phrynocephalus forsythii]|uniref:Uncharacterized protein n=1 Tax=Phrynocephalus forsythii TaxID=171643 RepID=A0A9Q0XMU6_9SAUR|nr:hypothetical protein JRQ81_019368 [Phrynocephalus forsythii]
MAEASASLSGPGLGQAACLVMGVSRGFRRSVARLVAACLAPGSLLLLVARSAGMLGELEGELCAAYLELRVQALPADLGADEGLQRVARDAANALCRHHDGAHLQSLLLVNNADLFLLFIKEATERHKEGEYTGRIPQQLQTQ